MFPEVLLELCFVCCLPQFKAYQATSLFSFLSCLNFLFSFSKDGPAEKVQVFSWHYLLNPPECSGGPGRVGGKGIWPSDTSLGQLSKTVVLAGHVAVSSS